MRYPWKHRRDHRPKRRETGRPVLHYATDKTPEDQDDEETGDDEDWRELLRQIAAYVAIGMITIALVFLSFFCN